MTLFIAAVLVAAGFQSFCKLALLPRRWEFLVAALLIPLPFVFEGEIARTSLAALNASLTGADTLKNWCALIVIQELFTLVAGFSLLSDVESDGENRMEKWPIPLQRIPFFRLACKLTAPWKYLVFLPSVLLPAGVFYLQTRLFNALPDFEFRTITLWLAAGLPLTGILFTELVRLLRRDRETRILTVLHVEWVLILCAIFLPVAAAAQLTPGGDDTATETASLLALGVLAAPVLLSAIIFYLYHKFKRKKCHHVKRYPNS